jgi:hypothetical protein
MKTIEPGTKVRRFYAKGEVGVKEHGIVLAFDDPLVNRPNEEDRAASGLSGYVPVMWEGRVDRIPVWSEVKGLRPVVTRKRTKHGMNRR